MAKTRTSPRPCTYKGKSYLCLWIGETRHGYRARLQFTNSDATFWCNGSLVSFVAATNTNGTNGTNGHANSAHNSNVPPAPVVPPTPPADPIIPDDQDGDWNTVPATPAKDQTERDVDRAMDKTARHGGLSRAEAYRNAESRAKDMERVLRKLKDEGGLYLVNYYIPVELSVSDATHGVRIPNPASSFRGFAIHLDGSNWLMTAEGLASEPVQSFFANVDAYADFVGGEGEPPAYWDTPLRDEEHAKFCNIAERKFMNYVRGLHTSLIQKIANADQGLKDAQDRFEKRAAGEIPGGNPTQKEESAAVQYRHNRVRAALKNAGDELNKALECAERYDMTESLDDLFAGLRSAIRSEQEQFNAIADANGFKGSNVSV